MVQTRRVKENLKKKGVTTRGGTSLKQPVEVERLNTEVAQTAASITVGD